MELKDVFRALIKFPVYIVITFLMVNALAFSVSYYRLQGVYYSAVSIVAENNFIPADEMSNLEARLEDISNEMLTDVHMILTDGIQSPANEKRQYGELVYVGVGANFEFFMPLLPTQIGGEVGGKRHEKSASQLQGIREGYAQDNNIEVSGLVAGYRYYPDMSK